MGYLVYPTLDLFLYDLKEALNTTEEATRKNQGFFTKKMPSTVTLVDSDIESEYLELLPQKTEDFKTDKVEGYYYPVRLNDTYGLQINCSVNNQTEPQAVECFNFLKSEIESRFNKQPITLGQAWMLSGWLPEQSTQNPKDIAQDCYKAFCKDGNWQRDFQGEGTFWGGKIFQLWQPNYSLNTLAGSNTHLHLEHTPILIAIYPNPESAQKAANFYQDWIGLFCYYSKINWGYAQSRLIKKIFLVITRNLKAIAKKFHFIIPNQSVINSLSLKEAWTISNKISSNTATIYWDSPFKNKSSISI